MKLAERVAAGEDFVLVYAASGPAESIDFSAYVPNVLDSSAWVGAAALCAGLAMHVVRAGELACDMDNAAPGA